MRETVPGLVSTIIPVHNRAAGLCDAVASVVAQDYRPIEIIIVDDGSTDDTPEAVARMQSDHPGLVRTVKKPNAGPGAARESGRQLAIGEYMQYLDSDDVVLPAKFERQVAALAEAPDVDIAYGWTCFVHADGRRESAPWKGSGIARTQLFPSILVERWWDTPNPLYRRAITDRAGSWLPLAQEEDWEYDCRIGSMGATLVHVPQYVCEVRDHAQDRLSRIGASARSLRDRARAQREMYAHALAAPLSLETPEFAEFARRLFLLSRQCGAAGLAHESKQLFELAREASTGTRRQGRDFRTYRLMSTLMGWRVAGRAAQWADRVRKRS